MSFTGEFRLSMTQALRDQLFASLEGLEWAPLVQSFLADVEHRGGVYQLASDDELVYVGKSKDSLDARLANHMRKINGRSGGIRGNVDFRCVYVEEDLDAFAPEKILIKAIGRANGAHWNYNGFGNKDPGRNRDRSLVKANHFDRLYPIDLAYPVSAESLASGPTLKGLMTILKQSLPYTYRFAEPPALEFDHRAVRVATHESTARWWFSLVADLLPSGWTTVVLPGYVISYPDINADAFLSRTGAWTSTDEAAQWQSHEPTFDTGEVELDPADDD